MMMMIRPSLAFVVLSSSCLKTSAFLATPNVVINNNNNIKNANNKPVSSLSAFDVIFAETIASAAALPVIFVGTGTYLLNNESEEKKEEAVYKEEFETGKDGGDEKEVDIYRDTLLRYAGYANEVGEAFAPIVAPIFVPASYAVAITYVFADTIDKTRKVLENGPYEPRTLTTCAAIEGLDALVWQLAASVALPGYTIHQVVLITVAILTASGVYDNGDVSGIISAIPTAIGLATIPLIVKPLDELAEVAMEVTFRKVSGPYLESCEI